mmetsp:Transcript_98164/g.283189  ORF Transcript_98164/g.283189 Transcript_98164/m.283189 type:complete len:208 (+) Transcript_98164:806-1429(+)
MCGEWRLAQKPHNQAAELPEPPLGAQRYHSRHGVLHVGSPIGEPRPLDPQDCAQADALAPGHAGEVDGAHKEPCPPSDDLGAPGAAVTPPEADDEEIAPADVKHGRHAADHKRWHRVLAVLQKSPNRLELQGAEEADAHGANVLRRMGRHVRILAEVCEHVAGEPQHGHHPQQLQREDHPAPLEDVQSELVLLRAVRLADQGVHRAA